MYWMRRRSSPRARRDRSGQRLALEPDRPALGASSPLTARATVDLPLPTFADQREGFAGGW